MLHEKIFYFDKLEDIETMYNHVSKLDSSNIVMQPVLNLLKAERYQTLAILNFLKIQPSSTNIII